MAIRLVVCDIWTIAPHGNLLVRSALHDAIAEFGPDLRPGVFAGVQGLAVPVAIHTLLEGHGRDDLFPRMPAMIESFGRRYLDLVAAGGVALTPAADDALTALQATGTLVAIESALSRTLFDATLRHLTIGDRCVATTATDEVARGRPWPDMIDRAREHCGGIESADVAMVGDSPIELQEGIVARVGLVVGVATGDHDSDALAAHPHDIIVSDIGCVPELLATHAR